MGLGLGGWGWGLVLGLGCWGGVGVGERRCLQVTSTFHTRVLRLLCRVRDICIPLAGAVG